MTDRIRHEQAVVHARATRLPDIPVVETGLDFPLATLAAHEGRTRALLEAASRRYPRAALVALDKASRAWLKHSRSAYLDEIDAIARRLGLPGAYFFSINYEWACTCRAMPSPDNRSARLLRVLDWRTPGLGANIVCAKVTGAHAGPFAVMTWPGYTGILQVMAPNRFSAALNQAPMRKTSGFFYMDWAANRRRVWSMPYPTPAHLLRMVSEEARDFREARRLLIERPIAAPGIFTVAGVDPRETVVIERTERDARVRDGAHVAANHWEAPGWHGHSRGEDSHGRARMMGRIEADFDSDFGWLQPPILNGFTRLAMVADAKEGRMVARGFEATGVVTAPLDLIWRVRA